MNNNMTSMPTHKSNGSLVWNVLKILLALGLVFFVLSKTDIAELSSTLQNASIFWLIVSGVLFVVLTLLKTLQYYTLMRNELTYAQVLNLIVWQNAVSNFFLAGAGILTYITTTRMEHEMKLSRSVTIFFLTKVGDLTAIWLALGISSRLVWSQIGVLQIPVLVLLGGIGIVLAGFFLTILFRQRFVFALDKILTRLGALKIKLVEKGMSYFRSLATIKQDKILSLFGRLLLYSLIYLIITISWIYANLAIFHLQLNIPAVIFVSVLMQLISYFPISVFGGLGINETSALYFWSFFDVSQDLLAPALIGVRVVFYLFNMIPLIYLPVYSTFLRPKEQVHNEP
jgi:uncharacterized membrane protein YbhN (UPF0104 family)